MSLFPKKSIFYFSWFILLAFSCKKPVAWQDAIAAWSFADLTDQAGANSPLQEHGAVHFIDLTADERQPSKQAGGDGKAIYLDGSSWLSAGQGTNSELNISGKAMTLYVRMRSDSSMTEYAPLISKSGSDQNMAYSIVLHRTGGKTHIEAMLGSDDIGGAHFLKYPIPAAEMQRWHDILLRFNGKISELYVDGILRDNEVTEGEIRDWNHQPVLIGVQYRQPSTNGDHANDTIESTFKGWIDGIAIWNRYVTDSVVATLSGVNAIDNSGLPAYYKEKYRPQFHFTARKNWLNDPNGLVYYKGTYHLFFQYMPPHRHGAYKDWGHAVSTDLVHWEQIPQHITPHKVWGGCWSGSAVVDLDNSSGFQTGPEKPIIAFITNGGSPDDGFGPKCTQCLAYSTDGGKKFTYYDQNPVIKNINGSNRDPKVIWDKIHHKWILSLYLDKDNDYGIFASSDLRHWDYLSTASLKGVTECPGFEPLPVDGDSNKIKWLFFGANGHYVIGSFDGKNFTPETGVQTADFGKNFYAAQTWNNSPDGRCVHIAWMPTKPYPDMPFEQQMTFPTELSLRTTPAGIRVFRTPVREIRSLYDQETKWQKTLNSQSENPFAELKNDLYDINLNVNIRKTGPFAITLRGATIYYDPVKQMIFCGGRTVDDTLSVDKGHPVPSATLAHPNNLGEAPLPAVDGKLQLRILVDRTTIEIYGNDGQVVLSSCFMPEDPKSYSLTTQGEIEAIAEIHSLQSSWPSPHLTHQP